MLPLVTHVTAIDSSLYGLLRNQLRAIQGAGYPVLGISSPGPYVGLLQGEGVRHSAVPIARTISPWQDLVSLFKLYRTFRRERPGIVHTHTPKPGLLGQVAARLAGVPVVINTVHGFYLYEGMPSNLRRVIITMEKLAARCSHSVLFQNREDIEIALRLKICRPEQVRFLGNGIDLEQFDRSRLGAAEIAARKKELGIPADAPVVGFVGRLAMERKGLKHLLLAGRELVKKNPNIRIVLVGGEDKGKADAVTPEVAKEYGLSENTIFAGNVSYERMPSMYSAMDLLVLPSLFEGLPRALMEAAAMGIPAVASDVKGNREAVIDGVTGFLVPLGNNGELVSRIDTLLSDRTLAATMGEQARALAVREFDEKHVFDKVLSEYQATLSRVGDSRVNVEQSKDQVFESLSELPKVHD